MRITRLIVILLVSVSLILSACSSTASSPTVPQSPTTIQQGTNRTPTQTQETTISPKTPTQTQLPSPTPKPTVSPSPTTSTPSPTPSPVQSLSVHFIDVGQGDSILIDLGETEVLIDGGERNTGAVNYLSSYVDGAIEVMVATHTHADHIGGLIDVLAKYQVKDIWLNGDTATSSTYSQFMNSVDVEGATWFGCPPYLHDSAPLSTVILLPPVIARARQCSWQSPVSTNDT